MDEACDLSQKPKASKKKFPWATSAGPEISFSPEEIVKGWGQNNLDSSFDSINRPLLQTRNSAMGPFLCHQTADFCLKPSLVWLYWGSRVTSQPQTLHVKLYVWKMWKMLSPFSRRSKEIKNERNKSSLYIFLSTIHSICLASFVARSNHGSP